MNQDFQDIFSLKNAKIKILRQHNRDYKEHITCENQDSETPVQVSCHELWPKDKH